MTRGRGETARRRLQGQQAAGRNQRSEIRRQRSGAKLISDLRLLTSVIDYFNGLNDFPFTTDT